MTYLIIWAVTAAVFLVLDGLWLGWLAKGFYFDRLDGLLRDDILMTPAALFYLGYTVAVVILAVRPGEPGQSALLTAGFGALVGFAAYGTYNATNYSTLEGWPLAITLTDIVWGSCLTAVAGLAGHATKSALL